jgi:hypothetical protein
MLNPLTFYTTQSAPHHVMDDMVNQALTPALGKYVSEDLRTGTNNFWVQKDQRYLHEEFEHAHSFVLRMFQRSYNSRLISFFCSS